MKGLTLHFEGFHSTKKARDSILQVALPDSPVMPPGFSERDLVSTVTANVAPDLLFPIFPILLRHPGTRATVPMPEAPIDKYGELHNWDRDTVPHCFLGERHRRT